jgi:hypothetical protein
MMEHPRKHGPFDRRWPRPRRVADARRTREPRSNGFGGDALLRSQATWEGEGGALGVNGKAPGSDEAMTATAPARSQCITPSERDTPVLALVTRPWRSSAQRRHFVVDTSGMCRVETETSKKRRAVIAWCDELIAHLRANGERLDQLREETQALRDRLATSPALKEEARR